MPAKKDVVFKRTLPPVILAGLFTFVIFGTFLVIQNYSLFRDTMSRNVFVHLASSFLQGRLDIVPIPGLDVDPAQPNFDLSPFHGKLYAMWPPFPAFLLMPLVYFHGVNIGDKWINVFLASLGASFGWMTIELFGQRAGWKISMRYKILMTAFLTCGTSFLVLSLAGSHYYMAEVVGAAMLLIALFFLFSAQNKLWRYLIAGLFWGFAILSRMHLILAAPVFLYVAIFGITAKPDIVMLKQEWKEKTKNFISLFSPIVPVLLFIAWYNWTRFGSIFDCGTSYHLMHPRFINEVARYGYIHPHYFWNNFYYNVIRIPFLPSLLGLQEPNQQVGLMEGYSIFLQSPPLLYALNSFRSIKKDALVAVLWISIALVSIPILWLMGHGWVQFGSRYLFDLVPLLLPLTIIGSRGRLTPLLVLLIIFSVVVNFWGLFLFSASIFNKY